MEDRKKMLRRATLAVIGTIIGAGVFALPALFARVGFWPASLLFWFLAVVVLATHLLYVEVILAHKTRMRLPGHVGKELGPLGHWIAAWTYPLQAFGACFAYLILGGEFLAMIARWLGIGGGTLLWQCIFWLVGAVAVFIGLKFVAKIEGFAVWLLIASILLVVLVGFDFLSVDRFAFASWNQTLIPFGVFLFALSGVNVMGEVVDLTKRNRKMALMAVTIGTLGAAVLSWLFGLTIAFLGNGNIDGIDGVIRALPFGWAFLIPIVGLLAVVTSYLTIAQDLKATLHLDFGVKKFFAWFVALMVPLAMLLTLNRDFLSIIGAVGAVFGAINGMLVAAMAIALYRRRTGASWKMLLPLLMIAVYATGMIYKLFYS